MSCPRGETFDSAVVELRTKDGHTVRIDLVDVYVLTGLGREKNQVSVSGTRALDGKGERNAVEG